MWVQSARVVSEERAHALAAEYGVPYIGTSAKENHNVHEAFMQLATGIKKVSEEQAAADAAAAAAGGGTAGAGGEATQPLVLTGISASEGAAKGGCC